MILRLIYIFLSFIVILYGILKKRKLDFVFIYFLSSILYFFPLYLGEFQAFRFKKQGGFTYTAQTIYYKCYIVLILNTLICFLWMLVKDRYKTLTSNFNREKTLRIDDYSNALIIFIQVILLIHNIGMIFRLRDYIYTHSFNKTILLQQITTIDTYCITLSYFLFILVYSFHMRWKRVSRVLAAILMVFPLLLSKRSEIVCGIISIVYVWINKKHDESLWKLVMHRKKMVFLGLIFGSVVFLSKPIINAVVQGNWEIISSYLTQNNVLLDSMLHSEANTITSTLNEILRLDYRVDGESYVFSLLGFFPFINSLSESRLVPKDFYKLYQPIVYPQLKGWGAANCFLGEAYSNGGIVLLIGMVILLCTIFTLLERYLYRGKNLWMKVCVLATMPYLCFYIHRNTWYYTIRFVRVFFFFAILLNIFCVIFEKKRNSNYSHMKE